MNDGERDVAAVNARMAELVRKFVVRTGDDVAQMRACLAELDAARDDGNGDALAQIQQLAHRACGTGGTLGLMALSDAAGALERHIEAFPANARPDAAQLAQIAADIDRLAVQIGLL